MKLNLIGKLDAAVPQGSVFVPLLFLVYINDLTDIIICHMRLFADDSSLFPDVEGVFETQEKLVRDLQAVTIWLHQWKMVFNPDPECYVRSVFHDMSKAFD